MEVLIIFSIAFVFVWILLGFLEGLEELGVLRGRISNPNDKLLPAILRAAMAGPAIIHMNRDNPGGYWALDKRRDTLNPFRNEIREQLRFYRSLKNIPGAEAVKRREELAKSIEQMRAYPQRMAEAEGDNQVLQMEEHMQRLLADSTARLQALREVEGSKYQAIQELKDQVPGLYQ